ncbi:MAG: PepSY-like domain-containing protein [Marinifilaceae bacterium]
MKKIRNFLLVAAMGVIALQSCDKNDGNDNNVNVPIAVRESLNAMYPGLSRVEWKQKGGYYEAEFTQNNEELSVWFLSDGDWSLTETDISFNALPQTVKDAFNASNYASWKVDDVDKLQRKDIETVYVIDVEQGDAEMDLYFAEDGVLIKEVADNDNDEHMPANVDMVRIQEFITEKYPSARIVDVEKERRIIEVEIIDQGIEKEVSLTEAYDWLSTTWEVKTLPAEVQTALNNSEYAGMSIDDMDFVETPQGDYYLIELEQAGTPDVKIKITAQGEII